LFGDILGVGASDLITILILSFVIIVSIIVLYRPLLVVTFDPVQAKTLRISADLFQNILLIQLAVTIVLSMQTVGVGLVTALLITPGAAAYLLTRKLSGMMIVAGVIGAVSSIVGLYVSYYLNIASGAAVVLTATLIFILTYLLAPRKGVIGKLLQKKTLQKCLTQNKEPSTSSPLPSVTPRISPSGHWIFSNPSQP